MRRFLVLCLPIAASTMVVLVFGLAAANAQSPPLTSQTRKAIDFYGSRSALHTLNAMPRRSAIQPNATGPMSHNGKPFQMASTGPTVSPYLNLFRNDERTSDAAPNYYAFVRPQLEQQMANQQQQREIEQLQQQLQGGTATHVIPQYGTARESGAGTPARYMDTAQFYGGWRR